MPDPQQPSQNYHPARHGAAQPERPTVLPPVDPHTLAAESMPQVPVVHWKDLIAAPDLDAVRALYSAGARTFDSEAALVAQLQIDWRVWRNAEVARAIKAPLPTEYPDVSAIVDGKPRTLVGIVHTLQGDPDVYGLQRKKLARYPLLLAEQHLGFGNFRLHSSGMEIPDHFAHGIPRAVLADEVSRWSRMANDLKRIIKSTLRRNTAEETIASSPETEAGKSIALIQRGQFKRDATLSGLARMALRMPVDLLVNDLPTGPRIDLATRGGTKLDRNAARSAYMAEFLRFYDPEQTLATLPSSVQLPPGTDPKHAAFVCGAAHVQEILFFWEHGVKDERISQRARRDAALLSSNPALFVDKMERMKRDAFLMGMGLTVVEFGAVFGAVSLITSLL